jgi:hypothetical protein
MQYLKILLAVRSVECLTTFVVTYNVIKIKMVITSDTTDG